VRSSSRLLFVLLWLACMHANVSSAPARTCAGRSAEREPTLQQDPAIGTEHAPEGGILEAT